MPQLNGNDSAVDRQYEVLREAIVDGTYRPGTVLLETTISKEYGVSRTPAREALTRLTQEGLMERVRRGYQVRVLGVDEIIDIYDARIALESTAASLAAERRTSTDIEMLDMLLEGRLSDDDSHAQANLNKQWHQTVVEASHNATIVRLTEDLRTRLQIYRRGYETERAQLGDNQHELTEHRVIVEAIRARDARTAHDAMAAHLKHGQQLRLLAMRRQRG